MLTVIADHNIAHLNDYFNAAVLGTPIKLVSMAGRNITADVLANHQPDALLIRSVTPVNARLLADNDSVKFVGSATIGTDHVDFAYLDSRDITFANAAGCSKHSVAQYVLTAILTLRPKYWQKSIKLGIIGLGNIGGALATYTKDLGWQVLGFDPFLPPSSVNNASFDEVLQQSDVVSLHVPLTTAEKSRHPTYHLFNAAVLAQLATHTMLINSARGQVISETDLLTDITKTNRPAVIDVFEHEPVVSAALLKKLSIATPHIAGYTLEGKLRGSQMIFNAFIASFADRLNITNPPTLAGLLPVNPYHWQDLLANPSKLPEFYNIKADDEWLRGIIDKSVGQVHGQDFDKLRKNYKLRREWKY